MTRSVLMHRRGGVQFVPGTLLSADSFNRTNSTTNLGSTDGVGFLDAIPWVQHGTGVWGINANQAYVATPHDPSVATVDLCTGDVDISALVAIRSGANGAGISFRVVDENNFWYLRNSSSGNLQLFRVVAAAQGIQGTFSGGGADGQTLRVVAVGNSISCYRNGTLRISATNSQFATATQHGLYNAGDSGSVNRLDDWAAYAA